MTASPFTITPTPPASLTLAPGQEGKLSFTVTCMAAPDQVYEVMLQALVIGGDDKVKEVDWLVPGPKRDVSVAGGKTETVTITARPTAASPHGTTNLKLAIADKNRPNDTYAYSAPVVCEVVGPAVEPKLRKRFPWWIPAACAAAIALIVVGALVVRNMRAKTPPAPRDPCGSDVNHPCGNEPAPVPAVFAHVPADTPYLVGAFTAVPLDYYAKLKQAIGPSLESALQKVRTQGGNHRLLDAILGELNGKWDQVGLESLGLSAQPRFAVYGLGVLPVVARLEIKDERALQATIERIAANAGETLPEKATLGGHSYWKVTWPGATLVVALADNQLSVALGQPRDIEAQLGVIVGTQLPAQSMADGKLLKELMAKHRFGPHVLGFIDTKRFATAALDAAGLRSSPACTGEIERLSTQLPRVVFGDGEMSASKTSGGMVLELSPDAIAALRAIKTEIPGLATAMSDQPMMALAAAFDVTNSQNLGRAVANRLQQLGGACVVGDLADLAGELSRALSNPLPEPWVRISGGAVSVDRLELAPHGGAPTALEGIGVIGSPNAKALFDQAIARAPDLQTMAITADGKLHQARLSVPFSVFAGVGDQAIVLVAGDRRRSSGESVLNERGSKTPLFAMGYDFDKLLSLWRQGGGSSAGALDPVNLAFEGIRNLFSRGSMTLDVTDNGLAMSVVMDMR